MHFVRNCNVETRGRQNLTLVCRKTRNGKGTIHTKYLYVSNIGKNRYKNTSTLIEYSLSFLVCRYCAVLTMKRLFQTSVLCILILFGFNVEARIAWGGGGMYRHMNETSMIYFDHCLSNLRNDIFPCK